MHSTMGMNVTVNCHTSNITSPERMSIRYENDDEGRKTSGFADSTYATIFDRLEREGSEV